MIISVANTRHDTFTLSYNVFIYNYSSHNLHESSLHESLIKESTQMKNKEKLFPWHQQAMFTLEDSRLTWCVFILSYFYHVDYSYDCEYIDALMIYLLCYR